MIQLITSDIVLGYGIFALVGYAAGHAAGEANGFINMFDFSKETKIMITKFWRELSNKIFGKGSKDPNKVISVVDHGPEILAKKNNTLSTK